ncbi:MAG: cytochrome c3 family protein [Candidatus Zixiibacteriota bacterium]
MGQRQLWAALTIGWLIVFLATPASVLRAASLSEGPDDATCLGCHDGYDKSLDSTPHRLSSQIKNPSAAVACVSCHAGGAVHAEDPSAANISNPSRLVGHDAVKACASCHQAHRELDNYGFDAHAVQETNCASCHKVHNAAAMSSLRDNDAAFCGSCHTESATMLSRRSNHPVRQGAMSCLSCHQFAKRSDRNQAYDLNRVCQDCHPEQSGPFPNEHAVATSYSVEGGGCVECHNPHGSENDHLLKQSGNRLCQQCHVVPGHQTAHSGAYANYDCVVCHTDTHGSFQDWRFLDRDLGAKLGDGSCYCHSLN